MSHSNAESAGALASPTGMAEALARDIAALVAAGVVTLETDSQGEVRTRLASMEVEN